MNHGHLFPSPSRCLDHHAIETICRLQDVEFAISLQVPMQGCEMSAVIRPDFIDGCSCRVWAIDGWETYALASAFNNKIDVFGNRLWTSGSAALKSLDEKVELFVGLRDSRLAAHDKRCTIYGFFEYPTDVAPTHMWLEYVGYIYDTIPGRALVRRKAGPNNRFRPGCVDGREPPERVGRTDAFLTKRQSRVLKAAEGNWVKTEVGIEEYTPENSLAR